MEDAPTVVLIDDTADVQQLAVPPEAVADILPFLRQVSGIQYFEARNFAVPPAPGAGSTLLVSVYYNENGRDENEHNAGASQILGFELYGKAIVVCSEELEGDEHGEGGRNEVCGLPTFMRKLDERGRSIPRFKRKIVADRERFRGRVGDVLHKIKLACEDDAYAGIPVCEW